MRVASTPGHQKANLYSTNATDEGLLDPNVLVVCWTLTVFPNDFLISQREQTSKWKKH